MKERKEERGRGPWPPDSVLSIFLTEKYFVGVRKMCGDNLLEYQCEVHTCLDLDYSPHICFLEQNQSRKFSVRRFLAKFRLLLLQCYLIEQLNSFNLIKQRLRDDLSPPNSVKL